MTYTLHHGDCLQVMPTLEANSVDTIITDPPYGLSFMGKDWDHGVPGVAFWREALRVAKPGAMLLAFGGTRTFHRLTVAIEDAGWEVRDVITWLHGQGFPKGHDISKALDKRAGAEREVVGRRQFADGSFGRRTGGDFNGEQSDSIERTMLTAPATDAARTWQGWNVALKPAWEPVILAMKPLDGTFAENALRWNVAGLAIDKGRIATDEPLLCHDGQGKNANTYGGGWKNYEQGTGRQYRSGGRWPANLLLDEDAARALDAQSGTIGASYRDGDRAINGRNQVYGKYPNRGDGWSVKGAGYPDTGGASRFFYVAKASRAERNAGLEGMGEREVHRYGSGVGRDDTPTSDPKRPALDKNFHPTVKPLALMRYLCRLTSTPTGGVVLDPFMGSGTTGVACAMEGRHFIGVELDAGYFDIARKRIESVQPALMEAAD